MKTRREALLCCLATLFAAGCRVLPPRHEFGRSSGQPFPDEFQQLLRDLEEQVNRPPSEEGVPMFLVCEDLSGAPWSKRNSITRLSFAVSFDLRDNARLLPAIYQEVGPREVQVLLEVLAEREFGTRADNGKSS
jgi:hypothetical protein